MNSPHTVSIDGCAIAFENGQTIMEAATEAGVYIPHLCHHPELTPRGNCRLCTVRVNGRTMAACITPAADGQVIENASEALQAVRRSLLQMLFVEGNHICPTCQVSGSCQLQALAYHAQMVTPRFPHAFPKRSVDASHPDVILDFDRCIVCELCVRASRELDGKEVFVIGGRGASARLMVNSPTGRLGDSDLSVSDRAAHICPVGAILLRSKGFEVPIGERLYDRATIERAGHRPTAYREVGHG